MIDKRWNVVDVIIAVGKLFVWQFHLDFGAIKTENDKLIKKAVLSLIVI